MGAWWKAISRLLDEAKCQSFKFNRNIWKSIHGLKLHWLLNNVTILNYFVILYFPEHTQNFNKGNKNKY